MNTFSLRSLFKTSAKLLVLPSLAFALLGCGGGGDDAPPTIRPKTLDDLVLILDGQIRLQFNRTIGTSPAVYNGDVETGTFLYTASTDTPTIDSQSLGGVDGSIGFRREIQTLGYTYRAINDASGIITISGFDVNDTNNPVTEGSFANKIGPVFGVAAVDVENSFDIDVTFTTDGFFIDPNNVNIRDLTPGGGAALAGAAWVIPAGIETIDGFQVPENYNPTVDPNRPSKIAPESLSGGILSGFSDSSTLVFTGYDFDITFSKTLGYTPFVSTDPDEIGTGLVRVDNNAVELACNYTWKRIGGTDNGTLVLSGITDIVTTVAVDETDFNGSYLLEYAGNDNGDYTGPTVDTTGSFLFCTSLMQVWTDCG